MKIRLSGDVMASGLRAWVPGRPDPVELADEPAVPLGEPVALGPDGASEEQVRTAVNELARLVQAAGAVAAGAGVDLGSGFRSARLAGARGDRRDAVLAALKVLGAEQAGRLGDRAGYLVALFGPAATKRVGAAATLAISEGRWAAVQLASAASDMLGPEQLERVLALRPAEGTDLIPGPASALAQHLRQVLDSLPGPRRLELLLDLWAQVEEHRAGLARRERLLATQGRRTRVEDLRARRQHFDDDHILAFLRGYLHPEPSLADAARWAPPNLYWNSRLRGLVEDALATTALLRTAVAVADHGLEEGLESSAALLRAAERLIPAAAATATAAKVPGLTGLPARPGAYVRDILRWMSRDRPRDHKFAGYVRPRLAIARDYALVITQDAEVLLDQPRVVPGEVLRSWASSDLRSWRRDAGYSPARPPAEWGGIPHLSAQLLGHEEPLSQRLAATPGAAGLDVEMAGDLLWYADMADALAALYGHHAAQGPLGIGFPWLDHDPAPPPPEPLSPRLESITRAISGAAQLIALGGVPASRARGWHDFTNGLLASASISEAITGDFRVPAPLTALDESAIAGTGLRLRVARNARTLAEWSDYMGNCIAGQEYTDLARAGRIVLTGLYDKNGALVINAELLPLRPAARGWRVGEIRARFNDAPGEAIERRFREWVDAIPAVSPSASAPVGATAPGLPDDAPQGRARRSRSVPRLVEDAGQALSALARHAWKEEVDSEVLGTFAALAGTAPDAALARLRRLQSGSLTEACKSALDGRAVTLPGLWAASGVRPLRTAAAALDPALRDRFDQLSLLFGEPPMAKSLRRLVKLPAIADAYALDLVARRVRTAIGNLAIRDDAVIARALADRATEPLLCALTVMISCRAPKIGLATVVPPRTVAVPGYPATVLDDEGGPWQRALPHARELGADTSAFWDEIAEHGLRVPASWLAAGGWTALWARAHKSA